jgi:ribonuclease E
MYDPVVQLKSGGYLVINPTEALVSIDINSGRSTKEHGIEATALNTNLEAAREIARQLRLRDMAGLVVIDFIDMEHTSNIRKVERTMKDSLKNDRARIQVGRISGFGLMEMSRQRLRTGVLEATTRSCPHCDGTGLVRTASSASLSALRLIEDEAAKGKGTIITLYASTEAAIYLLNAKRADLGEIEHRYGVIVQIVPEGEDEGAKMRVLSSGPRPTEPPKFEPIVFAEEDDLDDEIEEDEDEEEEAEERRPRDREDRDGEERGDDRGGRDRNKRRRRRGGRNRGGEREEGAEAEPRDDDSEAEGDAGDDEQPRAARDGEEEARDGERPKKRRRRGGRGRGRRREGGEGEGAENGADDEAQGDDAEVSAEDAPAVAAPLLEAGAEEAAKPKRRSRSKKVAEEVEPVAEEAAEEAPAAAAEEVEAPAPKRRSRAKKVAEVVAEPAAEAEPEAEAEAAPVVEAEEAPAKPKRAPRRAKAKAEDTEAPATQEPEAGAPADGEPRRGGWWQRTFGQ